MGSKIQVGDKAPDFALPATTGEMVRLSDFLGKTYVVVYFYPKDDTPGCTKEACAFRDSYEVFKQAGAEVIGISSDSVEEHQRFRERYKLPFLLLSDKGGEVRKRYNVPKTFGLIPGRVTYVIDKQGIIRHIFNSQFDAEMHREEALKTIKELSALP
ncbi:peroxiredoxin Q/BCP [Thermosporothrix hazakensis]|jgi:peroxiredoxin Q/BCP|uniref:thioredoxin-dependent peroxiredoxin n=2 Tax=Thermosporothrix TaxID=768650 RepID=A0A326UFN1_THEHA|nr:peroxiredoxin [Thermosporothrix hazakensis]PZW25709.1 peroxiredoxin Q/BCP [Thermosporothrix hazakensis]BBH90004.1 peroxiredoxin [Thermosporothrix sp. COM3]GCE48204.1 peroxiredoxin [Thermosporothrix hazakensis]